MSAFNENMVKELESDLQKIMQTPEFDLYQFEALETNFSDDLADVLSKDERLKQKVVELFSDPYQFILQEKIATKISNKELGKSIDITNLMAQATAKLQQLSSKEIFDVFDSNKYQFARKPLFDKMVSLLNTYYIQTNDLSHKNPKADLHYTEYAQDNRWTDKEKGLNYLLDLVGKFTQYPELENMVEEKISRIFSHYNLYSNRNEFYNLSYSGCEEFGKRMLQEINQNPNSPTTQFYIKYTPNIIGQGAFQDKYIEFMQNFPQDIKQKYSVVYNQIIDDFIKTEPKRFSEDGKAQYVNFWQTELKNNPDSKLAEFYTDNAYKYLDEKQIKAVVDEFAISLQKKHPQISAKLLHQAEVSAQYEKIINSKEWFIDSPLLADTLEKSVEALQNEELNEKDLQYCYYLAQKTGLKCYEQAAERILSATENINMPIEISDFEYKPMFDSFRKNGANFSKLERFDIQDPYMSTEDITEFYDVLMQNKPINLHSIREPKFSLKQAINLMEKYPDLAVHVAPARFNAEEYKRYGDLFMQNWQHISDSWAKKMQHETPIEQKMRLSEMLRRAGVNHDR